MKGSDSGHLVSYVMAPSTRSSGNKVYHGHITKKQLLKVDTQIKWANIRKKPNGTVGNFYSKKKREALKQVLKQRCLG